MNIKKIVSIILISVILILSVVSCQKGGETETTTTLNEQTTPSESKEEVTTTRPDYSKLEYTGKTVVKNDALGLRAAKIINSNPYVCDTELTKNSIVLYCYTPGTATLDVEDFFGNTAKITVEVKQGTGAEDENKKDLISTTVEKCANEFIEVSFFGAKGDGSTDDTKAFQAAIDAAKPGDTVYVYPGRYEVSLLTIKEGVTLRMYSEMTDAKKGYTSEITKAVKANKYAILSNTRILNNGNEQSGAEGSSNFSIIGGVFDINRTTRSTLIFGCADNVRLENIIFKDIKGNHVIQLTGCTNSVVENCMFAGYDCGDAFTRETIQIEPSTPGATGGPLTFENGEYNCPKNITINNCYFGKSDEAGAPLMAIGHHSQVGEANVTGLKITNNVFDEVLYAGIRYNNLVDVEITGNTFISTDKYMNATQFTEAKTPAFIILYHATGSSTYTASNGLKITEAVGSEQAGHHNIKIENNTFNVGKGSDKRIIDYTPASFVPGATFQNLTRQDKYTDPAYNFNGYSANKNFAENISFSNNTINFEGQPTYTNYYIKMGIVFGLKFEGNKINFANGVDFSIKHSEFEKGQQLNDFNLNDAYTYKIETKKTDKIITIIFGDKTYKIKSEVSSTVLLKKKAGGNISFENDEKGNLTVTVTPAEGYKCDKITDSSNNELPAEITLTSGAVYNIAFAAK